MKVPGTGAGQPPIDLESVSVDRADSSPTKGLEGARSTQASEAATPDSIQQAGGTHEMAQVVSDLSADLKAGRLSPEAAVDALVQRVLDRQLGTQAAPELRLQLETALRATLAEDPFVGAHVAALGRTQV